MENTLTPVTAEQAEFIEEKTKEMFAYTIDCFDRARVEGNNVLQWLFGVITGGVALASGLKAEGYPQLAVGVLFGIGAAAVAASKLISKTHSRETLPPGNYASYLSTMLDDTAPRMRWREALGMDDRISKNLEAVSAFATAVDKARWTLSHLPWWVLGGTALAYVSQLLYVMACSIIA